MKKRIIFVVILTSLLGLWCSLFLNSEAPTTTIKCPDPFVNKGNRLIGMDILNPANNETFMDGFNRAKKFGIEFTALHVPWTEIEKTPNVFTDPDTAFYHFNIFCSETKIKLSLTIRPIDLTGKTVPSDLVNTRFNSLEMKNRFKSLIDFICSLISPSNLTSIQIGNEIDGYDISKENPEFWDDYTEFLKDIHTYVGEKYPTLKIGFTCTLYGLLSKRYKNSNIFESMSKSVDIVGITYYPINDDFTVKEPSVVYDDFKNITDKFPNKTIYIQEIGYPTSKICNSSDDKQAQFICDLFQAWDTHLNNIKLLNFVRLNDVSDSEAKDLAGPYGINNNEFIEYLRTLGFSSYSGKNKGAFLLTIEQATLRGW